MGSFVAMMASLIGSTLDGVIISHFLKDSAFGAYGLAMPLITMIELVTSVIATGCVVVCSNLLGEGRLIDANRVFSSSLTLSIVIGTASGAVLYFFPEALEFLVPGEKAGMFLAPLMDYLQGLSVGVPAILQTTLLISIVQLEGGKARVIAAVHVLCLVNLAGDLLVVLFTNWGMFGVGLVTSFSYYCAFFVLMNYFFNRRSFFFPIFTFFGSLKVLVSGVPSIFNRMGTMLRVYLFNMLTLGTGGPAGIVAWSTVSSLSSFLSGFPKSFGQEALVGSGVFFGEEDKETLTRFMRFVLIRGVAVILVVIAILYVTAPFWVDFYLPESSESFVEAVSGLRWYGLGLLPYTLNLILANYMQSTKRTVATDIITFMDGFGMLAPFALFFMGKIGFHGIWLSFFFGKSAVFVLTLLVMFFRQRSIRLSMKTLLMLPKNFDVPDQDKFLKTISFKDEVVNISEQIIDYCKKRGLDNRRSYFAGLAIEEMADIIMDEGFGDGVQHYIDIKLFVKEDQLVIRMRDDCKGFDTNRRIQIMNPPDPIEHPGIRILRSISKESKYYSALNVNYLTMRI